MAYDVALERKRMIKQLNGLGAALGPKGMRSALVGYTGPIKKEIKNRIRSVTGDLKKSIGHRSFTTKEKASLGYSGNRAVLAIGSTRKVQDSRTGKKYTMGHKLNWLDQGVKAHDIVPRKGKKVLKIGSKFVKMATHKGFRGRHILDKSLSASASASRQGFDKALARFLDKHA